MLLIKSFTSFRLAIYYLIIVTMRFIKGLIIAQFADDFTLISVNNYISIYVLSI